MFFISKTGFLFTIDPVDKDDYPKKRDSFFTKIKQALPKCHKYKQDYDTYDRYKRCRTYRFGCFRIDPADHCICLKIIYLLKTADRQQPVIPGIFCLCHAFLLHTVQIRFK